MSAPIIQADYEQLEEVARRFATQAELIQELDQTIRRHIEDLHHAGWVGEGATAFFGEMEGVVFTAVRRLIIALEESSTTTHTIIEILQAAEEEAANQFSVGGGEVNPAAGAAPQIPGITPTPGRDQGSGQQGGGGGGGGAAGQNPVPGVTPTPTPGKGNGQRSGDGRVGQKPVPGTTPPPRYDDHPGGSWGDQFSWDNQGEVWEFDYDDGTGEFEPGIELRYGINDKAVFGDPTKDGLSAIGGSIGVGTGVSMKGPIIGPYGEFYVGQGTVDGVWGGDNAGLTGGLKGRVLAVDGFAGYKDGSIGATIGGSLVSVEGEAGVNVAGANVGVKGEVGLKAELGFKLGKETEVKLPFVTIGFSFGRAKKD